MRVEWTFCIRNQEEVLNNFRKMKNEPTVPTNLREDFSENYLADCGISEGVSFLVAPLKYTIFCWELTS